MTDLTALLLVAAVALLGGYLASKDRGNSRWM
jgi:hypothetical protein